MHTIVSYSVTLAIFMNLNSFQSPLIGLMASVIYSVINAVFLGNAFLAKEKRLFQVDVWSFVAYHVSGLCGLAHHDNLQS
jgi:hypothetical protein